MIFKEQKLSGVWVIEPELIKDPRGFFARIVCEQEFAQYGLRNCWVQQNIAYNQHKGTLRGMHYQRGNAAEIKAVRCTLGAIYDVVVDLRKNSPTYQMWLGVELSARNHQMLYIPEGFAHGYITLEDETEISYLVSAFYTPGEEAGLRYDDPFIGIQWPVDVRLVSEKDSQWALLR